MMEADVQEDDKEDEEIDKEEDVGDVEEEEKEVAVVVLQDGGVWKCPLCTNSHAYKQKSSVIRHLANVNMGKGNHN